MGFIRFDIIGNEFNVKIEINYKFEGVQNI